MLSAALRKSVTDLTRRRGRTALALTTLALAVASISFFAIPTLIDRAMRDEVRADRLADVALTMRPVALDDAQLAALAAVRNVAAVEARATVDTRVLVGERRVAARIIGVRDFTRQGADVVRLADGALPRRGEVLVDVQNANTDVYAPTTGDTATILTTAGASGVARRALPITGEARNIDGGEQVQDDSVVVLYATADTVHALSGDDGYGRLALRLDDPSPQAAAATVDAVRRALATVPGFTGLRNLPEIRAPGDWPGKADTEEFAQLLSVITLLALLSALVLISSTMTTLVAEQTGQIAVMRAIGARRRQVTLVYLRTALLLGTLGALGGVALGIGISNLAASFFGSTFWAVDVGFGADATVVAASLAVGIVAPAVAALPAIRRGVRTDLREALDATGAPLATGGWVDRVLRRVAFLPRTMQLGLRGVGRRKRRSLATAAIVALAVGNLLAIMGLAVAVSDTTRAEWDDHLEDVRVWTQGREPFDARAQRAILATPGVAEAQPALVNDVELDGEEAVVWGVPHEPLVRHRVSAGRWFTAGEERTRDRVAVIERNLARVTGTEVGDRVPLATAAGHADFRIVGVADNQQENGTVLFVPLTTVRELVGDPSGSTTFWIRTTSPDHGLVDRTTNLVEDRLAALGYEVGNEITYAAKREEVAANRTVTTSIAVLGFLVVAISMVGLANAVTTSVLERTREVGVLRCLGARARDVRRVFATEGLTVALVGWLAGIPLGYALDRALVWLVREVVNVDIAFAFPPLNVLLALAGTLALALLITLLPIRRAVRLRPGDALRYG